MPDAIEVEGLKELSRDLKKLDKELLKELKAVNKDAAEVVATEARVLVPVRSGRLKSSIKASGTQAAGLVRAGKAGVPYTKVIHFGWARHNIKPQPFLYEALDKRKSEVYERYEKQVNELVERTFNG